MLLGQGQSKGWTADLRSAEDGQPRAGHQRRGAEFLIRQKLTSSARPLSRSEHGDQTNPVALTLPEAVPRSRTGTLAWLGAMQNVPEFCDQTATE